MEADTARPESSAGPGLDRRGFLGRLSRGALLAGVVSGWKPGAGADPEPSRTGLRITKVRSVLTAPEDIRLVIVKVETSEAGLYGVGCATFTQRAKAVATAIDRFLDPFLRGKDPTHIEDLWQAMYQSSYWRNGPVLMNAISGVDMALWDILGKRAGMPLYQLLGGKCRTEVPVYGHASGRTPAGVADAVRRYLEEGYRYVRAQVSVPGQQAYGAASGTNDPEGDHFAGGRFEPAAYQRAVPRLFEHLRAELGDEVELLHDVHERLHPIQAIALAKDLEPFRLFFLEDPFAPEDVGYFRHLRAQCATPIAMGELFNHPLEWVDLISGRLIDFIRCHLSQVGGISVGRKIAALCDFFRVRTAWHGPGDVSPVGHAANLHLDLATWNFGVQEAHRFREAAREVFPGTPEVHNGALYPSDAPGLGVDIDEERAARFPVRDAPPFDLFWGRLRGTDGTIRRP